MKKPLFYIAVLILVVSALSFTNDKTNTQFEGTYVGTTASSVATDDTSKEDTVVIQAGASKNEVKVIDKQSGTVFMAKVSRNTITLPKQKVYFADFEKAGMELVTGKGKLVGNTLMLNINFAVRDKRISYTGTKM